jgi:hypothetical protein
MTNAHASMVQPAGGIRKNTVKCFMGYKDQLPTEAADMQAKISNALNMGQSQYTDGEPIVHLSTLNIAEE